MRRLLLRIGKHTALALFLLSCSLSIMILSEEVEILPPQADSIQVLAKRNAHNSISFMHNPASFGRYEGVIAFSNSYLYCNTAVLDAISGNRICEVNIPWSSEFPMLYSNRKENVLYVLSDGILYKYYELRDKLARVNNIALGASVVYEAETYTPRVERILYACADYIVASLYEEILGCFFLAKVSEKTHDVLDVSPEAYYSMNDDAPIFGTLTMTDDQPDNSTTKVFDLTEGELRQYRLNGMAFCDAAKKYIASFDLAQVENDQAERCQISLKLYDMPEKRELYSHILFSCEKDHPGPSLKLGAYSKSKFQWARQVTRARVFDNGTVVCTDYTHVFRVQASGNLLLYEPNNRCVDIVNETKIVCERYGYLSMVNISLSKILWGKRLHNVISDSSVSMQVAVDAQTEEMFVYDRDTLYCYGREAKHPYCSIFMNIPVKDIVYSWSEGCLVLDAHSEEHGRMLVYVDSYVVSTTLHDRHEFNFGKKSYLPIRYKYIASDDDNHTRVLSEKILCKYDKELMKNIEKDSIRGCNLLLMNKATIVCEDKSIAEIIIYDIDRGDCITVSSKGMSLIGVLDKYILLADETHVYKYNFNGICDNKNPNFNSMKDATYIWCNSDGIVYKKWNDDLAEDVYVFTTGDTSMSKYKGFVGSDVRYCNTRRVIAAERLHGARVVVSYDMSLYEGMEPDKLIGDLLQLGK